MSSTNDQAAAETSAASSGAAAAAPPSSSSSSAALVSSEFPDFLLQRIPVNVEAASTVVALEVVSTYGSEMVQIAERLLNVDGSGADAPPSYQYCALFLRAVAIHADLLFGIASGREEDGQAPPITGILLEEEKSAATVIKAIGCAATQCLAPSDISQSGILPVLATLAVGGRSLTSLDVLLGAPPPPLSLEDMVVEGKQSQQQQSQTPPSNELFTLVHAEFLQCCMAAGHYRLAGRFLKEHSVRFLRPLGNGKPTEEARADTTAAGPSAPLAVVRIPYGMDSYLKYFYLAGTIYMANLDYREAQFAFQVCVSTPAKAVSAIAIAARKRLLLCRCALLEQEEESGGGSSSKLAFLDDLDEGADEESDEEVLVRFKHKRHGSSTVLSLPSATPTVVMEYMDGAATEASLLGMLREDATTAAPEGAHFYGLPAYYQLTLAYEAGSVRLFHRIRRIFAALWKADGNAGFVQKCADVFLPSRLLRWRLARVYQVTSLETVSRTLQQAGMAQAAKEPEEFLLRTVDAARRTKAATAPVVDLPTDVVQLDHVTQMVYFDQDDHEEEEEQDEGEVGAEFLLHPCMDLARRVRDLDVSLSTMGNYQLLAAAAAANKTTTKSSPAAVAAATTGPRGVTEI